MVHSACFQTGTPEMEESTVRNERDVSLQLTVQLFPHMRLLFLSHNYLKQISKHSHACAVLCSLGQIGIFLFDVDNMHLLTARNSTAIDLNK